jgi:hypothetical protein
MGLGIGTGFLLGAARARAIRLQNFKFELFELRPPRNLFASQNLNSAGHKSINEIKKSKKSRREGLRGKILLVLKNILCNKIVTTIADVA